MGDLAGVMALARALRALDAGETLDSPVDAPSVHYRVLGRQITDRIRADRAAEHERLRAELMASLARILSRVPVEPFWSPTPILGFRVWEVEASALSGMRRAWPTPEYVAGCAKYRLDEVDDVRDYDPSREPEVFGADVPHTDCTCGIYAVKSPDRLVSDMVRGSRLRLAFGVVALSGKVVEHDQGYRAQRAQVEAMIVPNGPILVPVEDRLLLRRLFTDPSATIADRIAKAPETLIAVSRTDDLVARIVEYLEAARGSC